MEQARLLADIGGTNARFAWQAQAGAPIVDVATLPCAAYAGLEDALREILRRLGRPAPKRCAIAIANPVLGDQVRMTNHHWTFSISALQARFGFEQLKVLNDFTALALALPDLQPDELRQLGGDAAQPDAPIALIGPGTGLGVSGLLPDGRGGHVALAGEGGHVTLAVCASREQQVLAQLARRHGHVSAERAVCGQGLVDLHAALGTIDAPGDVAPALTAADITAAALAYSDARCVEALNLFCAFLGTVAGNLALTLGARGGVYLGGGIPPRLGRFLDASPFRERFEAKGRFRAYLAAVPVFVIQACQSPALRGAARALDGA
ncbi:glucokinase [Azohydromonas caseinilytica]|uniref:Glucokinase n=1 Tax=Azohydromonas caseinilytica TaxID=2728836 RepID=A0A848FFZ2_9BURK|nr:glucokinase [Azohydromonas caseinilytica]NML18066.1 glucokinase [Azohydromonas caseinilytica]